MSAQRRPVLRVSICYAFVAICANDKALFELFTWMSTAYVSTGPIYIQTIHLRAKWILADGYSDNIILAGAVGPIIILDKTKHIHIRNDPKSYFQRHTTRDPLYD